MSSIRHWKSTLAGAALYATALVTPVSAQASRLYLLSGTPDGGSLPVELYSADPASLSTVNLVSEITKGLTCVLADYEQRALVVASPDSRPTDLFVVNMDAPETAAMRRPLDYGPVAGTAVSSMVFLDLPERGFGVAAALNKVTPQGAVDFASSLIFEGLRSSAAAVAVPFDDLKYLKFSGFAGGAITMSQCEVGMRGNPLRVLEGPATGSTGIPRPPYLAMRMTAICSSQVTARKPLSGPFTRLILE